MDEYENALDFYVDLENGCVEFRCGWKAPIIDMIDEDGDVTDDHKEADVIVVKIHERNWIIPLDEYDHMDPDDWVTFH